jgi:hypothetical protein
VLPRVWDALIGSPYELIVHVAVALIRRARDRILAIANGPPLGGDRRSRVLRVLEILPGITLSDVDDVLQAIWSTTPALFRRGTRIEEVKENPVSFAEVEWPVLRSAEAADARIVRVCQYLLRARGLGTIFFVVRSAPHILTAPCRESMRRTD